MKKQIWIAVVLAVSSVAFGGNVFASRKLVYSDDQYSSRLSPTQEIQRRIQELNQRIREWQHKDSRETCYEVNAILQAMQEIELLKKLLAKHKKAKYSLDLHCKTWGYQDSKFYSPEDERLSQAQTLDNASKALQTIERQIQMLTGSNRFEPGNLVSPSYRSEGYIGSFSEEENP